MMKKKSGLALFLAGLVLAGLVVMPDPALADVRVRVYAPFAPPAPPVEVVGVAPSPRHVWVAGFHRWDGRAYVWVPGHWAVRRRVGAVWVPGHWRRHARGYYWVEGHWR